MKKKAESKYRKGTPYKGLGLHSRKNHHRAGIGKGRYAAMRAAAYDTDYKPVYSPRYADSLASNQDERPVQ